MLQEREGKPAFFLNVGRGADAQRAPTRARDPGRPTQEQGRLKEACYVLARSRGLPAHTLSLLGHQPE